MEASAEGATDTAMIRAGARIGDIIDRRYEIDAYLGAGGMGEVYAATHLATRARVALKLLRPMHLANASVSRRFLREARFETAIKHPNVIKVSDVLDGPDGLPVIVMELLEGESLAARLAREGKLSLDEVAPIFLGVALGLEAARAQGIVHRDLKPDNIFLLEGPDGTPFAKVLDFGIAKAMDPLLPHAHSYGSATHHGSVLGTIPYMAYEQAMNEPVDHRADIWAFAVSMVEALSGRRPLHYDTFEGMFRAFLQHDVPPVKTLLPDLPLPLAAALDSCLVKKPDSRAKRLDHMIELLRQPQQLPSSQTPRRHSRRAFGFTGLAAGALACVGWALWRGQPTTPAPPKDAPLQHSEPLVVPLPASSPQREAAPPAAPVEAPAPVTDVARGKAPPPPESPKRSARPVRSANKNPRERTTNRAVVREATVELPQVPANPTKRVDDIDIETNIINKYPEGR